MRETKFIEQNQEKWAEFEQMLQENQHKPEKLNDLFIQITDDLSYARTFYPNRSVRIYLNGLAQKVFYNIYKGTPFSKGRLRRFWAHELPRIFWEERSALLLSFSILTIAFLIGLVSSIINPEFARVVLGEHYVEMTIRNIEHGDPMAVYKESQPFAMTLGIGLNNLAVAVQTAVSGVLASLGTIFILLSNGVMVGAFQYFFVEKGVFWQSFLTIWIHGTLEISTIIVAGAAGLTAGSGLIFPGTYRRIQAFQISMRRGLKIFFGIVPLIILAAIFESYFTRYTDTPAFIRGMFIAASLGFVAWYFVWLPWHKHRIGSFAQEESFRDLPPDVDQRINFQVTKNAGEILSDSFAIALRNLNPIFINIAGGALVCTLLAWAGVSKPLNESFPLHGGYYRIMAGSMDLFKTHPVSYLFYTQIILLVGMALAGLATIRRIMPKAMQPEFSNQKMLLSGLALTIPATILILIFKSEPGPIAWFALLFSAPLLSVWTAVLFFETANPLSALKRSFQLIPWKQGIFLGVLIINLTVLLFFFLNTPAWKNILSLFTWMVPGGANGVQIFNTLANIFTSALLLYFSFNLQILSGCLLYFTGREISDAASLREGIEKIGTSKKIRGLARE
jgi:uncharacterized membrane protein SpoIIM required for sporulation